MHTFFINLSGERSRRSVLEANFNLHAPKYWSLHRVDAVTCADVESQQIPGEIRDVEKACYLSHVKALSQACDINGHGYILEDDAHFGPHSFTQLSRAIEQLQAADRQWDILYTQVMPVCLEHMIELLKIRNQCVTIQRPHIANTRNMILAGACAYVVRDGAKHQLLNLLRTYDALDLPIDKMYWKLAREGVLQARVTFPLPSSVAAESTVSQIQSSSKAQASLLWNAWMRLSALDRNLDDIEATVNSLPTQWEIEYAHDPKLALLNQANLFVCDQEMRIMKKIALTMRQPNFISLFSITD